MGLDLCFTEAEFLEERKQTLDKIFRILPNKTDSHKAVDRYEKGFHWMFPSLHMPSLRAEQYVFLSWSPRSASFFDSLLVSLLQQEVLGDDGSR